MGLPVENKTTEQNVVPLPVTPRSSQESVVTGESTALEGLAAPMFLPLVHKVGPVLALILLAQLCLWATPNLVSAAVVSAISFMAAIAGLSQLCFFLSTATWKRAPHFLSVVALSAIAAVAVWVNKLPAEFLSLQGALNSLELAALGAALLLWLHLREMSVDHLARSSAFDLDALIRTAWKRSSPDSLESKVDPRRLVRGDFFVCRAGDVIPADAVVQRGAALLRERILSGHGELRIRGVGDEVYAGSTVVKGELTGQVLAELSDSKITSFLELLKDASVAPVAIFEKLSGPLIWVLPFAAACVALGWHEVVGSWGFSLAAAGAVLALVALLDLVRLVQHLPSIAIRAGFDKGILFHTRAALEAFGRPKEVVLEQSSEEALFGMELRELALLDERIDRPRMESALLAICSRMGEEYAGAFERKLLSLPTELHPCQVSDYHEYSSMGVAAVVEGAEFSLGSEEFLIARGVRIQPSELVAQRAGEFVMYIALGDELVARAIFAEPRLDRLGEKLFRHEVELRLLGTVPAESLDNFAKRTGVELALTAGGLSVGEIQDRIRALRFPVLFAGARTEPQIIGAARAAAAVFDPIRWDIERTNVTLFSPGLGGLESALKIARRTHRIAAASKAFIIALACLLAPLSGLGYVPAAVTLLAALSGLIFLLLLAEGLLSPNGASGTKG